MRCTTPLLISHACARAREGRSFRARDRPRGVVATLSVGKRERTLVAGASVGTAGVSTVLATEVRDGEIAET
jgi:hypothetical protein